jgi:hypothetical protein
MTNAVQLIEFYQEAVEDRAATQEAGGIVCRDVDYCRIINPGGRDVVERPVVDYIASLDHQIKAGTVGAAPLKERFVKLYDNWKANRDPELPGVKLKDIPLLSPAELKTATNAKIFTVEQLAEVGEIGLSALGMGARELQKKAKNYLLAMNDQGKLVQENIKVSEENAALKAELKELQETVALLKAESRVNKNKKEAA